MSRAIHSPTEPKRRGARLVAMVVCLIVLLAGTSPSLLGDPPKRAPRITAPKEHKASVSERLESFVRGLPSKKVVGSISVRDAETGGVLFEHHASTPLLPASNAKLFVMAAALDQLGPDFRFVTELALRGSDLLVVGSGDPGFGDPKLCQARGETPTAPFDRWAAAIKSRGIERITGDLILDESIFDDVLTHPSWETTDLQRWYGAPTGALNVNDNCVEITLRPARKNGAPVFWEVFPPNSLVTLDNRCVSGGKGEPTIQRTGMEFRYLVSGRCNKVWPLPSVAVPDPGGFFGDVLRTMLLRHGLTIGGKMVRWRDSPTSPIGELTPLAEETTSLVDVLARVGKDSQNVFAECLAKRLGYEWARVQGSAAPRGTWSTARAGMHAFLERVSYDNRLGTGDPWQGLVIDDASGLSRANRATADQFTRVLAYMAVHPHGEIFASSLAAPGQDGSLERRGGLRDLGGRLVGKTGTLRGVRSLSGYLVTEGGRRLAFSILLNDNGGAKVSLNDLADQFCDIIADWPA